MYEQTENFLKRLLSQLVTSRCSNDTFSRVLDRIFDNRGIDWTLFISCLIQPDGVPFHSQIEDALIDAFEIQMYTSIDCKG